VSGLGSIAAEAVSFSVAVCSNNSIEFLPALRLVFALRFPTAQRKTTLFENLWPSVPNARTLVVQERGLPVSYRIRRLVLNTAARMDTLGQRLGFPTTFAHVWPQTWPGVSLCAGPGLGPDMSKRGWGAPTLT
jgi:hypothetical protein